MSEKQAPAHRYTPCRVSTVDGSFLCCGHAGCADPRHATMAAAGVVRPETGPVACEEQGANPVSPYGLTCLDAAVARALDAVREAGRREALEEAARIAVRTPLADRRGLEIAAAIREAAEEKP